MAKKQSKAVEVKAPKQARLPEMDDPKIEELESLAEGYAEVRDERMELNKSEVDLKDKLLAAMKKHRKEHYHHNGIDIKVVVEEETVKVRVKKEE
jgi:hypothetical protein